MKPIFFVFIFSYTYIIIAHVYTYSGIRGICAEQFFYGFNVLEKLEDCPNENQNPYEHLYFWNFVYESVDLKKSTWTFFLKLIYSMAQVYT